VYDQTSKSRLPVIDNIGIVKIESNAYSKIKQVYGGPNNKEGQWGEIWNGPEYQHAIVYWEKDLFMFIMD